MSREGLTCKVDISHSYTLSSDRSHSSIGCTDDQLRRWNNLKELTVIHVRCANGGDTARDWRYALIPHRKAERI